MLQPPWTMRAYRALPSLLLLASPLAACGGDSDHGHGDSGHPADAASSEDGAALDATAGCTPSGVTEADATRTTAAASITVDATLLNALQHCAKPEIAFKLVLDTHSVDLLGIDLLASARLETDGGELVTDGFGWTPVSETSHHREGTLTAPAPPLLGAAWLRLTVQDVGGVDRVFEWDATYLAHDLP